MRPTCVFCGMRLSCSDCDCRKTKKIMNEKMSDALCADLCKILLDYCGETGKNEGAVQTLKRKLKELKDLKEAWPKQWKEARFTDGTIWRAIPDEEVTKMDELLFPQ